MRSMVSLGALLAVGLVPGLAGAVYECGGVTDDCECGMANPFPCCEWSGQSGNCTWYAWHSACCNWHVDLGARHDAHTFNEEAQAHGFPVSNTPCAGTVFCCEAYASPCTSGEWGHVGWVTNAYPDGSVDVLEEGCYSWNGVREHHYGPQGGMSFIYQADGSCGGSDCDCNPGDADWISCERCGARLRTCDGCHWGEPSECMDQGSCEAGEQATQPCEGGGQQVAICEGNCEWGPWGACEGSNCECEPGGYEQAGCELCGVTERSCEGCYWSEWSACGGQGVCEPGAVEQEACSGGTRQRVCDGACGWGPWGECSGSSCECGAGEQDVLGCGLCGEQSRSCDGCYWLGWSDCGGEGVCEPGVVEQGECEGGTRGRACEDTCVWGDWGECHTGGGPCECVLGEEETLPCGPCGIQTRRCDGCGWLPWSLCVQECLTGEMEQGVCPGGGTMVRFCMADCQWGEWSACPGDEGVCECLWGEEELLPCALCGTKARLCDGCDWGAWGECSGQGDCEPGDREDEPCADGTTRPRLCQEDCRWDKVEPCGRIQDGGEEGVSVKAPAAGTCACSLDPASGWSAGALWMLALLPFLFRRRWSREVDIFVRRR